ncbi:MAG: hypothetical protein J6V72_18000, partial [Kiritimatiellae bacterium]|nr:hypothetical protein [Kiritimatiellia bacterium]
MRSEISTLQLEGFRPQGELVYNFGDAGDAAITHVKRGHDMKLKTMLAMALGALAAGFAAAGD